MRTDAELMVAVGHGDRAAFRELHDRHVAWMTSRLARRCADRDVVAEAVQDTFVAVWKGAAQWDGRGEPAAWMWGIGIRRLIGVLRTRQRWSRLRRPTGRQPEVVMAAEEQVLCGVEHGDLAGALLRLSPELRAVVQATVLDGLSTREAARLLDIPQGTVKTRMMRAPRRASRSPRMIPSSTWHASDDVLARFAVDPAGVEDATAASIEAHLLACTDCRHDLARLADPALAAGSWGAVADRIDAPPARALERVLLRLGVRSGPARLAAATPGLRLSGVTAVIGLTAIAVLAAGYADAQGPFLVLAPLVPLVAVALTFAAATDPGGEAGVATPLHGTGLAIRRATAVLALAFVVLAAGALALPDLGSAPLGWMLPAGALAVGGLAVGTWIRIELALGALAATWVGGVALVRYLDGLDRPFADTAPFTPAGQAVALAVIVAAVIVLAVRADRYSTLEART